MKHKLEEIINKMLEEVRDVRAIPQLKNNELEKEVIKRLIKILETECEDEN